MLSYLFAVLAAGANAVSSVLQRKANRLQSKEDNLSWRLIADLLRSPTWFLGVLGVIVGFLLQAAALRTGALAVVEPILIIELPLTLLLAGVVFRRRLHAHEWRAVLTTTAGLAALLYFLSPGPGSTRQVSGRTWFLGLAASYAVVAVLVALARCSSIGSRRSALLGVAGGASFGTTAALIKAVTDAVGRTDLTTALTIWQTYAMALTGILAMFLVQSALNAGTLVTAQPGLTIADPLVSILWGAVVFHEQLRHGPALLGALAGAGTIAAGVISLSRSPEVVALGDAETGRPIAAGPRQPASRS